MGIKKTRGIWHLGMKKAGLFQALLSVFGLWWCCLAANELHLHFFFDRDFESFDKGIKVI